MTYLISVLEQSDSSGEVINSLFKTGRVSNSNTSFTLTENSELEITYGPILSFGVYKETGKLQDPKISKGCGYINCDSKVPFSIQGKVNFPDLLGDYNNRVLNFNLTLSLDLTKIFFGVYDSDERYSWVIKLDNEYLDKTTHLFIKNYIRKFPQSEFNKDFNDLKEDLLINKRRILLLLDQREKEYMNLINTPIVDFLKSLKNGFLTEEEELSIRRIKEMGRDINVSLNSWINSLDFDFYDLNYGEGMYSCFERSLYSGGSYKNIEIPFVWDLQHIIYYNDVLYRNLLDQPSMETLVDYNSIEKWKKEKESWLSSQFWFLDQDHIYFEEEKTFDNLKNYSISNYEDDLFDIINNIQTDFQQLDLSYGRPDYFDISFRTYNISVSESLNETIMSTEKKMSQIMKSLNPETLSQITEFFSYLFPLTRYSCEFSKNLEENYSKGGDWVLKQIGKRINGFHHLKKFFDKNPKHFELFNTLPSIVNSILEEKKDSDSLIRLIEILNDLYVNRYDLEEIEKIIFEKKVGPFEQWGYPIYQIKKKDYIPLVSRFENNYTSYHRW